MGMILEHPPVVLLMAAFSRYPAAIDWARSRAESVHGPVALASEAFAFVETAYYEPTMGNGLNKVFWAFELPFHPENLVEAKLATNAWEQEYAQSAGHKEPRPLNLDPGYITLAKLVLASTKDHAHRIYLCRGIYAEVTLYFKHQQWRAAEWTFPDYRRHDYHLFFSRCRDSLKQRLKPG